MPVGWSGFLVRNIWELATAGSTFQNRTPFLLIRLSQFHPSTPSTYTPPRRSWLVPPRPSASLQLVSRHGYLFHPALKTPLLSGNTWRPCEHFPLFPFDLFIPAPPPINYNAHEGEGVGTRSPPSIFSENKDRSRLTHVWPSITPCHASPN